MNKNKYWSTYIFIGLVVGTLWSGLTIVGVFFCSISSSIYCAIPRALVHGSPVFEIYRPLVAITSNSLIAGLLTIVCFGLLGSVVGGLLEALKRKIDYKATRILLPIILILIALPYIATIWQRTSKETERSRRIETRADKDWMIVKSVLLGNSSSIECSDVFMTRETCYVVAALKTKDENICSNLQGSTSDYCRSFVENAKNQQLTRDLCYNYNFYGVQSGGWDQQCSYFIGVYLQDKWLCDRAGSMPCDRYIRSE